MTLNTPADLQELPTSRHLNEHSDMLISMTGAFIIVNVAMTLCYLVLCCLFTFKIFN